jgi:hypothetical protein
VRTFAAGASPSELRGNLGTAHLLFTVLAFNGPGRRRRLHPGGDRLRQRGGRTSFLALLCYYS